MLDNKKNPRNESGLDITKIIYNVMTSVADAENGVFFVNTLWHEQGKPPYICKIHAKAMF